MSINFNKVKDIFSSPTVIFNKFNKIRLLRVYFFQIAVALTIIIVGAFVFYRLSMMYMNIFLIAVVIVNYYLNLYMNMSLYELRSQIKYSCTTKEEKEKMLDNSLSYACILSQTNMGMKNILMTINILFCVFVAFICVVKFC